MSDKQGKCVSCGAESPDQPLCGQCDDEVTGWTWMCRHDGCADISQETHDNVFAAKAAALRHGEQHCRPNHYQLATLGKSVSREQWEVWRG